MDAKKEDNRSAQLVDFLREKKPEIMNAWIAEVKALPHAQAVAGSPGEEAMADRMRKFYDLIVDHIANPEKPLDGEFLPQLMWQAIDAESSPTDIARVQLLLKKSVTALLFSRFSSDWPLLSEMCSRYEAEIDEARLRTHELYHRFSIARLEEIELRSEVHATVSRISTAIISATSSEQITEILARELRKLIRFDLLTLGLLRENRTKIETYAAVHSGDQVTIHGEIAPREELVIGRLAEEKEPRRIDSLNDADFDRLLRQFGVQSYITAPLHAQDQPIGAILLGRNEPKAFSNTQASTLRRMCGEVAAAISNLRLMQMSKRRSAELAVLNEVGTMTGTDMEITDLLEAVATVIQQTFAFYDVGLFLVDKASNEVVMTAQAGAFGDLLTQHYRQKIGHGMVGWAAQQGQTLVANDVSKEPRRIVAHNAERAAKSELCVPIKVQGEVVGVINVESTSLGAFDERDVTALEMLSGEIAEGVESARLRSEAREAQRRLTHMMTHLPIAANALDMTGLYTHWSSGSERMFGYGPDEVLGKRRHGFQAKRDYDLRRALDECRTWGSVQKELPMRTKDGRDIWVYEAMANLYDDAGNQIGFTVCLQDITERRRAEEEVRREQENLTNVLTAMGAGVSLIDRDMRVVWANKSVVNWFRPGADVTGLHCYELYHGRNSVCKDCVALKTFETGQNEREEHVNYASNGKRICFLSVVTPFRTEGGKVTQVLKLSQDITEHAERMEQLALIRELGVVMQETLERDRAIFATLTCVTAGTALGFNRAFLWLRNTETDRLEGVMAVGPIDAEEAGRIWHKAVVERQTLRTVLAEYDKRSAEPESPLNRIIRALSFSLSETKEIPVAAVLTKEPIFVQHAPNDPRVSQRLQSRLNLRQFVCVPLIARGRAIGAVLADNLFSGQPIAEQQISMLSMFAARAGLAIDNAEAYERIEDNYHQLAETRDRLVRSERLAAIGNMAAHVAHEIRNPLVTIGGFARAIMRQADTNSSVLQAAGIIAEEVSRLERILANVLNFTKPAEPKKVRTNINTLINDVSDFVAPQFESAGAALRRQLANDIPEIMVDPGQIRQVLLNLLRNGLDSLRKNGSVTVVTQKQNQHVKIEIRDTGQGMSPDVLENMFNPFFTTKPDGTGLGLAVTRKVIEDHGGDIFVESSVGEGTTFNILLPLEEQESHI